MTFYSEHYDLFGKPSSWRKLPEHPTGLGADVAKYRALARVQKPNRDVSRAHGEAVEIAIRKLQRTELMRALTPTPSLKCPAIPRPKSPLTVPYTKPNPFEMVGDPKDRDEKSLYLHAIKQKLDALLA